MLAGLASARRPSPAPTHTLSESSAPSTVGGTGPFHGQAAAPWDRPREADGIALVVNSQDA
eukprot:2177136-Lingulodinium_polyedra.AAC.1